MGKDAVICSVPVGSLALALAPAGTCSSSAGGTEQAGTAPAAVPLPVGLENRGVCAAVGVILQLGAVLGLGVASSSLQKGWAFAGFAEVAGQGAHSVPSASRWASASALVFFTEHWN